MGKPFDDLEYLGIRWEDLSPKIHATDTCPGCGLDWGEVIGYGHSRTCPWAPENKMTEWARDFFEKHFRQIVMVEIAHRVQQVASEDAYLVD